MCGVARCGATRCGDHSALVFVTVNGTVRQSDADGKIKRNLSISEQSGAGANTATLTGFKFTPVAGHEVIITLGSINNGDPIFAGRISRRGTSQQMKDSLVYTSITAADYAFDANQRLISKRYTSMSASAIAQDLIDTFATQLSGVGIVAGLATLDEITFTNETFTGALSRLAERIGGYFTISYAKRDSKPIVRLFLTPNGTNPTAITETSPTFNDFKYSSDLSQVITRVYVEGNGSTASAAVSAGSTYLPITSAAYASASGGIVTAGPQRITYTGYGSLAAPSAPSVAAGTTGGDLAIGTTSAVYKYKIAYLTATGAETLASSASSTATLTAVSGPGGTMATASTTGGSMTSSTTYVYTVTFLTAAGESPGSVLSSAVMGASDTKVNLSTIPTSADARVTGRKLYRSNPGGGAWFVLATISDNSTTTYADTAADSSLTAGSPGANTSNCGRIALSSIPVSGDSRVTSRAIYRTAANGSIYKRVGVISDNTTTTYTDTLADTSLGDAEPVTSNILALTGIPASGAGSIVYAIAEGDSINLVAQVDDTAAQTALAALVGGDGIREASLQDRRLSLTEATARGTAFLELRSTTQASVSYTTRDKNTRVGTSVSVTIGDVSDTFKIQSVQIHTFSAAGSRSTDPLGVDLFPTYTVTASNQRFSLEDLLRQLKGNAA